MRRAAQRPMPAAPGLVTHDQGPLAGSTGVESVDTLLLPCPVSVSHLRSCAGRDQQVSGTDSIQATG